MNRIPTAAASPRRRFLFLAALTTIAVGAALAGCAGLTGPHTINLSESELTLLLARQFPIERKVLDVIDLQVTNPQLRLLPDTNRVATELDFSTLDRLFGTRAQGHLNLDYGLRFNAPDHSIRLSQVRVRELNIQSGAGSLRGAGERLGSLVAEDLLENLPIYKMKPAQAEEMDRLNLVASDIHVTAQGISLTLSPKAQ